MAMTDRERQYRLQSRLIADRLAERLSEDDALQMERASGLAICPRCKLELYEHPQITAGPCKGLYVTCNENLYHL